MSVRHWLNILARDLSYALRRLVRNPAFTLTAALSLALGIGANTAAFGVLYAVLFKPLAVKNPSALVVVTTPYFFNNQTNYQYSFSYPAWEYLRAHATTLDGVIAFRNLLVNVGIDGNTDRVTGTLISGNYFDTLGVDMTLGAPLTEADARVPGSGGARGPVAVLSHRFWTRRFNADPGIIGRAIRLNGHAFTVAGVAPASFTGTTVGAMPDVFVPITLAEQLLPDSSNAFTTPDNNWLRIMGRVRSDSSVERAQAEMTVAFRQFNQTFIVPLARSEPARRRVTERAILLQSGRAGLSEARDDLRTPLFILAGLVGVVLLIACVNVANLLLARAERYYRDTAIQTALGASTLRLWSQSVVETLVLAAFAVALGLVLAHWMRDVLVQLVPASQTLDLSMDGTVLAVSALLGLLTALCLGSVSGWQSTRLGVMRALKGEDVATRLWLRKALIIGQLALSIVVLVAAALFARTLGNLRALDPGFDRERILLASADPRLNRYALEQSRLFYRQVVEQVRALPGVAAAALADAEPMQNDTEWNVVIEGTTTEPVSVPVVVISDDYFKTMGIGILRGRDVEPRDDATAASVAIVNETFVRRYLADRDPIGRRLMFGSPTVPHEIVGVVKDSRTNGLRKTTQPVMYLPMGQSALGNALILHVRAAVPPGTLAATVEETVRRVDPEVPVFNVRTIEQRIDQVMGKERTFARLSSTFGLLALILSAVGLYGIIAYSVTRRTKELGIRLALGAGRRRIMQQVLGETLWMVAIGVVLGLPLAYMLARTISSMLFGVEPGDWRSVTAAIVTLVAAAILSAWLPARRASRVDPLKALRYE